MKHMNLHKRKPSPDFSDEGLVKLSFNSYFLQHLPGQHFELPLQQSAANDVAGVAPINAAKVAIRRRYFMKSSFLGFVEELGHEFQLRRADCQESAPRGGGISGR